MKKSKKVISLILSVMLIIGILPMSAFSADTTKYWVSVTASPFDGSGGTISGEGEYAPGEQVTISIAPNTDGGYCAAQWGLADIGEGVISAIEQKASHTFTMPENAVQISITFTQHSYITYSDLGDGTHQNKCFYCGVPNGVPENHIDAHGGGDGVTTPPDGYCDKCSAELHTHSYSSGWSSDEEGHYHECSCGATSDFAEHTSSGAATEDAAEVCIVCGYEISSKLTIYTITPSAEGGNYDADTNTLTIVGGGTVNLTLNVSGYVRFYDNGEFTMTPVNGTADSATEWTTNLPNTNKTYHFYHSLSDLQAECIVIVKKAYTLTIDYSATLPDEILVGSGIADKTIIAPQGEVIDLSEYWPDELTYSLGGNTYYFNEFLENATGGETIRSVTISDDLTVYAYWTTEKQITITFDPNGGSLPYEKVREECCNISNMNRDRQPTRSGYDFVGWSLENDGTADDGDIQLTEDCTLYAVWKVNSLSAPANLRWDTSNGTVAVWDAVDGATNYIVELYKKDIITLHLLSHVVSDTSFDYDLTSLSPGSYYFTVRATFDDIKSESATSNDILTTSGGTPILINGSSERVDYIAGTAYIVDRDDIANGSISEVDMTPIAVTTTLTNEQATELIAEWITSWDGYSSVDTYKDYIRSQLVDYSLADLEVIRNNIERGIWPNDFIADVVIEKIESKEATDLVIAPGYIDANTDRFTVKFSNTQAEMNNEALQKILDNLGDGDNVKISVKDVGAEVLPDSLTKKGAYGGSEAAIDKSIFEATGIENIEDRLQTLGLINGNTDSSVTEDEFEYLYHYLTTDELTALKNELNESAHFEHHQNAVNWLTKMIERDATMVDMSNGQLNISGILSKLEAIGYTGGDFTLGFLRQADLDMEHLEYIRHLMQQFVDDFDDSADEIVLAWAKDAIAQKELEALYAQMDEWIDGLSVTDYGGEALEDAKLAAESMTTAELERFLENAHETNMMASSLALGDLISFLEDELEAREASDTPTYIQVGGTSDGINPIFIGAVDVNIGAVKADGTTTPIAIKADRSDAVAWSTYVPRLLLDLPEWDNNKVRAYKVLENNTLEAKGIDVKQNVDGTLILLSAFSNGSSTYVFLLMPGYEITLNENYSGGATSTLQTDADGKLTSLPTPTRSGYNFLGWFDSTSGGNEITVDTVFSGATEIYAQWQRISAGGGGGTTKYTVTFETAGRTEIAPVKVERNGKVEKPETPINGDAVFMGWYTDKGLTEEYDFNSKVTKSFTLYAKWSSGNGTAPGWINPFTDVNADDWFCENVMFAYKNGLMKGTSKTTFAPNLEITRGMFVTILYRMENEPPAPKLNFADVPANEYYANAVAWANANGIVNGISDTEFAPNTNITREQMAAILYRYAQFKKYDVSVGENTNILSYTDFEKISEYAISAMQWACGSGLIKGRTESTLNPQDNATRAETAAILMRFIEMTK